MTASAESPPLDRRHRRILTPEGVALTVMLGERGSRAAAFLIDLMFIVIVVVVGGILLFFSAKILHVYAFVLGLLGFFLLRVFYFPFFELHWRGATPGKRLLGLKVIDRDGGPLRPEAIVVRNLMREVEVFVPLTLLMTPHTGLGGIGQLLLIVWMGIFVLMPLFNRVGLRVGDLVAGTLVIAMPKAALLPDLAGRAAVTEARRARFSRRPGVGKPEGAPATSHASRAGMAGGGSAYTFTPAQLGFYGAYELQTLESILRRKKTVDAKDVDGLREIVRRIASKIGWPDSGQGSAGITVETAMGEATAFLESFYAAQRAHLERRMLFGHRRKDKHDKG
jgi:uncharacterized RDD family membrane protein YckC